MILAIEYRVVVRDRDGGVVARVGWRRSRSFVKQFLQILECGIRNADVTGVKDTGGIERTVRSPSTAAADFINCMAGVGVDDYGILVGTGTTTPDPTDYALEALIPHGSASGQLDYAGCGYVSTYISDGNIIFEVTRTFTNLSGATIGIREVGLASKTNTTVAYQYFLLARDLYTHDLADGASITFSYRIRVTT